VGRLDPSKGQDVLIESVAILKDQFPDIRVEFVGKGPSRQAYMALAERLGVLQNCHFIGALSHQEVLNSMALATLTVVPSRHEAFGLVNIESLAASTPVVASHSGGIREIVRSGVDGFLVTPGDAKALAEKIAVLLQDPTLRETMAAQARERFMTDFEQRHSVLKQADWLEQLNKTAR
jgi:glycosyltransferase involved in cell wall biosynthesis